MWHGFTQDTGLPLYADLQINCNVQLRVVVVLVSLQHTTACLGRKHRARRGSIVLKSTLLSTTWVSEDNSPKPRFSSSSKTYFAHMLLAFDVTTRRWFLSRQRHRRAEKPSSARDPGVVRWCA